MVDSFWKNHPMIWIITDSGKFTYPNKVVVPDKNWVQCNQAGLVNLLEKGIIQKESLILLLLEDHVPISPLRVDDILDVTEIMQTHHLDFVSLTGFGREDAFTFETNTNVKLYPIHPSFKFYSELHPAIWRVSHLLEMFSLAEQTQTNNPWAFELLIPPSTKHYTTPNLWTSVFSGFLVGGFVTKTAVDSMKNPNTISLQNKICRDYFLQRPRYYLLKLKRSFQSGKIREFIDFVFQKFFVGEV
jgi:hypothetical protein